MMRTGPFREFGLTNLGLSVVWGIIVLSGLVVLLNYEARPGVDTTPPPWWPDESQLQQASTGATVLMFAHPHCPCTRASFNELQQVVSLCSDLAEFQLVAYHPATANDEWKESALLKKADIVPQISTNWDRDGVEAKRFRVRTSGHVVAYAADGNLLFSGGITASRGHEGANRGRAQLTACLRSDVYLTSRLRSPSYPVYGCSLVDVSESNCDVR